MKLFYFKHISNFGDELNAWLWDRLLPDILDDDDNTLFLGIGSYLNSEWIPTGHRVVVFSSGAGYGPIPNINDTWSIYCVRGPLTARALNLDPAAAVTDAAALIQREYSARNDKCYKTSYIPHHYSDKEAGNFWRTICHDLSVNYIDPHLPVDEVLAEIQKSELLITEALHGAIVADVLRVPWVPVTSGSHILDFKWRDWCASLDMQYQPENLFNSLNIPAKNTEKVYEYSTNEKQLITEHFSNIIQASVPSLSDDILLERKITELEERLELFKNDYDHESTCSQSERARYANKVIQETERRSQVVKQTKSDIVRWSDANALEEILSQRTKVAAAMIPSHSTVLDLGCGNMSIEKQLTNCNYLPCDIVARDNRTIVCDFNKGVMPDKNDATIIVALEILEYIYDIRGFLKALHGYGLPVILSYITTDSGIYLNRADQGWVNGLSWNQLSQLLQQCSFNLLSANRIDGSQILLHLIPVNSQ